MIAPQFTPGPWTPIADDGDWFVVAREQGERIVADVEPTVFSATTIANARLIAAAPELYDALEAVDLARHTGAPHDWERATKLTDAALAKARGEA